MAEENNKGEKANIFESLEHQFDVLIKSNPYLLYLTQNEDSKIKSKYNDFKKYDFSRYVLFIILGFILSILAFGFYYVYSKYIINPNNQFSAIPELVIKSTPIIYSFLTLLIGIWAAFHTTLLDKSQIWATVFGTILIGIMTYFSFKGEIDNEALFFISPLLGYLIIIFSLFYIYRPLSSRTLRNSIIKETKKIRETLKTINKSLVDESHKNVLTKITDLENKINTGKPDLHKIHAISILDSLRLELIKNSINGITLVEDWKFLDLSQNMIDEIMTCENKKITILGDLSFLSTKNGLKMLVDSILEKKKSFEVFFTGIGRGNGTIESEHCKKLVKNFKDEYYKHSDAQMITKNIKLEPILSESFTGIGFIGVRANNDNDNERRYEKVFAYVTSLLIEGDNIDITRANPFVFSWKSTETDYFRTFLKSKIINENGENLISGKLLKQNLKTIKNECDKNNSDSIKAISQEIQKINRELLEINEEKKVLINGVAIKASKLLDC